MHTDLDLRKLRYFVAVAEELSFRRAAERLHIAQPVLSRQIRALEHELSVHLFDRGPKGTELTAVGARFLVDATELLASASAMTRRARRASAPQRVISVGVMPGLLATSGIASFRRRHPQWRVDTISTTWATQIEWVRDGTVDISLARDPVDAEGLHVVPVASEQRLALLPHLSPLAARTSVSVTDLAALPLLQDPALLPEWANATTAELRRSAEAATPLASVEEKLERVASGDGFVVLPRSTSAFYRRPDACVVPVDGLPRTVVSLVTREDAGEHVRELMQALADQRQAVVGGDA